ncbi:MAG TPA: hypothetical protein DIW85_13805 [Stenotrophomonas sp.]|nr:hypothetical protein [Stenotrophomonas sp.]
MRLFTALFLLFPGIALVASTYRHAYATATAVVVLVAVHATLHALAVWRRAVSHPAPPILHALDAHAAAVMLAASLLIIAISATAARLPATVCAVLLAGALLQLWSLRTATQRLRHALLALGSMLQFIAMALLTLGISH